MLLILYFLDICEANNKIDEDEFENLHGFKRVERRKKKNKTNSKNDCRFGRKR